MKASSLLRSVLVVAPWFFVSCGGKVTVEDTGSGGSPIAVNSSTGSFGGSVGHGGSPIAVTSTTGSFSDATVTTTVTTGAAVGSTGTATMSPCTALGAAMSDAFAKAVACNACANSLQCTGPVIQDRCGCPVGTHDGSLAMNAEAALAAFRAAGCDVPVPCPVCLGGGSPYGCLETGTSCTGTCVSTQLH